MKKLIFILFIFLFSFSYSQKSYIKYIGGNYPILISAPHGGIKRDYSIKNRDCDNVVCSADLYTDQLSIELYTEFLYGDSTKIPSLLLNTLHRQELDVNRPLSEAFKDNSALVYYNQYHNKIKEFIIQNVNNSKPILIIDIHGQSHKHGFIELGYNISYDELKAPYNLGFNTTSSLHHINNYNLYELVYGIYSLGYLLENEYKVAPSFKYGVPPLPYFNGGYITETYKNYKNVIVIQIELPYFIRSNEKERTKFIKLLKQAIIKFYNQIA